MKTRKIYYRKLGKGKIAIEGKINNKSTYIYTLPEPLELLEILNEKALLFTNEKWLKIEEKITKIDIVKSKAEIDVKKYA